MRQYASRVGLLAALMRYPLKSARGQWLSQVQLQPQGLAGDRLWACLDREDDTIGSLKHPKRWAGLLNVRASIDPQHERPEPPRVRVEVAGRTLTAGEPLTDEALSAHMGRPVRLTCEVPMHPRVHRLQPSPPGLVPDWSSTGPGAEVVTELAGARPAGAFLDYGAVHMVTTGALARLSAALHRPVAPVRFRPNLVVEADDDPPPGTLLAVGTAVLRVLVPTPRCIVPALAQEQEHHDPELLRMLTRHRTDVPGLGRAACFGTYLEVLQPGEVHLGQALELALSPS